MARVRARVRHRSVREYRRRPAASHDDLSNRFCSLERVRISIIQNWRGSGSALFKMINEVEDRVRVRVRVRVIHNDQ